MLYNFFSPFGEQLWVFNLFRYLTFRSMGAFITSFIFCLIFVPKLIHYFKLRQQWQPIRSDGPETHLQKSQTPTMGGIAIVGSIVFSTLLWANLVNSYIWLVIFVLMVFASLGFYDDYLKLTKRNSKGLSGKKKLLIQILASVLVYGFLRYFTPDLNYQLLSLPFFKNITIDLGYFYFVFASVVIVGSSNAVNLTDGLDGLVIVPLMIVSCCFALIVYLVGNSIFANYLQIIHIPNVGELAIFCSALIGSGLGFLWYNSQPAQIFMGDTGSLSLGGSIGAISIIIKHEIVLAIIGGLFVMEAISVIIQVYYFKFTGGKRFFKMAPIHHHFEKSGWSESKVVIRFWIIAIIFAIIGLSTLKIR